MHQGLLRLRSPSVRRAIACTALTQAHVDDWLQVCHRGHDVSYARMSRFFCDCGAGACRSGECKALKPVTSISEKKRLRKDGAATAAGRAEKSQRGPDVQLKLSEGTRRMVHQTLGSQHLLESLISIARHYLVLCAQQAAAPQVQQSYLLPKPSVGIRTDLMKWRRAFKAGTLVAGAKARADSAPRSGSSVEPNTVKQCLAVSSQALLIVGEGEKLSVYDCTAAQVLE